MSRVDVQTLVMAFENRIAVLDKNPPHLVPQSTISLLLENAIEEEIKNHFIHLIKKDIQSALEAHFKKRKTKLVNDVMRSLLESESFKASLQHKIEKSIISNLIE